MRGNVGPVLMCGVTLTTCRTDSVHLLNSVIKSYPRTTKGATPLVDKIACRGFRSFMNTFGDLIFNCICERRCDGYWV